MTTVDITSARTESEPQSRSVRVHVTGAFLVAAPPVAPSPSGALPHPEPYASLDGSWTRPERHESGTYHSGGGFLRGDSSVLVRRGGRALAARARDRLDALLDVEPQWPEMRRVGWSLSFDEIAIDIHEFGVATVVGLLRVTIPTGLAPVDAFEQIKALVLLNGQEDDMCPALARVFVEAARDTVAQLGSSASATTTESDHGRLLWLHPLIVDGECPPEADRRLLAPYALEPLQLPRGESLTAGIGYSVYCGADTTRLATLLGRMLFQWAVIAFYMRSDRELAGALDAAGAETGRPRELQQRAAQVFERYAAVARMRTRIDSRLAELGGDEQQVWDVIGACQGLPALIAGVERKLALLREIAEHRAAQATAEATHTSNVVLGWLSTLSVVGVVTGAATLFYGELFESDTSWLPRVALICFGVGGGVAMFITAYLRWWRRTPVGGSR